MAVSAAAGRLIRSGSQLQSLLDDLMDFNRTNLGLGISIVRAPVDLAELCAQELEQLRVAYPDSYVQLNVDGDCQGSWDARRMRQLFGNLVTNAIQYGVPDIPVHVTVTGNATDLVLEVSKAGPAIDQEALIHLFEPLKRATVDPSHPALGLGLYIVHEIAKGMEGLPRHNLIIARRSYRSNCRVKSNIVEPSRFVARLLAILALDSGFLTA